MLVRADITLQPPHPFAGLRGGFYRAISVDPASRFKCRTALQVQNWSSRRDTEKHYHTMSFEELAALPVAELASPDGCHLFVWTSGPFLPQAIALMGARRSNWDCWGDQVGFFGGAQS